MTEAALPAVQAALATLRNGWETGLANPRAIGLVFKPITLSYSGAFNYHTLHPIEYIQASQDYGAEPETTVRALARFRQTKDEELAFVRPAATLCGGAVIGVFSWPTTEKAIWVTKMLWHLSLFMSSFALIGSAQQRLLRHLPAKEDDASFAHADDRNKSFNVALSLFLQPPVPALNQQNRRISLKMVWFWQCPMMLMSYSWVFFLFGYALHLLTPVIDPSQAEISKTVSIITVCACALVVLNFAFCAGLCQVRLLAAGDKWNKPESHLG